MGMRKKKQSTHSRGEAPSPDVEVYEGGGLRFERHGRFIVSRSILSKEQHEELLASLPTAVSELTASITEDAKVIEQLLSRYDTFSVLSQIGLTAMLIDPNDYSE